MSERSRKYLVSEELPGDDEEFADESYLERIVALQGIFPGWMQRVAGKTTSVATSAAKGGWWLASTGLWYAVTTGAVVFLPYGVLMIQDQQALEQYKMLTARTEQHDMLMGGPGGGGGGPGAPGDVPPVPN